MDSRERITELLLEWRRGDREAFDRLIPMLQPQLVRLAQSFLEHERPGHTLQATALVNEAYLRLVEQRRVDWQSRAHFIAIAATIMRRILVDHARRRNAKKRGGEEHVFLTLEEAVDIPHEPPLDLIALDEALERLGDADKAKGKIVELRFFGGLTVEETAAVLGCSRSSVNRHWKAARTWLYRELATEQVG